MGGFECRPALIAPPLRTVVLSDGNKSAHLLKAGAVKPRRFPHRSAVHLTNTGNDSAHLQRAGAVKSRRAPLRSALGLFKMMVINQRTC